MNNEKRASEFERYMRKKHGMLAEEGTEALIHALRERELQDYADIIASHVDKTADKILVALGPPLTLGVLYLVMKTTVLMHPLLILFSAGGMIAAFFFAFKYDHAVKVCRYCGIGIAIAQGQNVELKKQNAALAQRVSELEAQLSTHITNEDIAF